MISRELYEHYLEKELLEKIDDTSFKEELMYNYKNYDEKIRKPDLYGKTVQVTKSQFGPIHDMMVSVAEILEIPVPKAYVYEDFYYGLESKGADEPWLEISAKTLSDFTGNEFLFLLAKEMCNIKLKHTYYYTLTNEFLNAIAEGNFIMGMDSVAKAAKVSMYKWSRISNYTSDSLGYLICKDLKSSINAILKLVLNSVHLAEQVNLLEYIKQAESINELDDNIYNFTKLDEQVPYAPLRVKNLIAYASSDRGMKALKELEQFKTFNEYLEVAR
jgi:hypothetical protein